MQWYQDVVENVKDLSIRYRQKVKFSETLYIKNIWVAVTIPYKKPTTIILKLWSDLYRLSIQGRANEMAVHGHRCIGVIFPKKWDNISYNIIHDANNYGKFLLFLQNTHAKFMVIKSFVFAISHNNTWNVHWLSGLVFAAFISVCLLN